MILALKLLTAAFLTLLGISISALGVVMGTWFALIQLISAAFSVLGWVLLIPFCLFHLWQPCMSDFDKKRLSDCWIGGKWNPVNWVYRNPEESVSGQKALIWGSGLDSGKKVPYMPSTATGLKKWFVDAWRAYSWSALRNSADNLKYVFANSKGKIARVTYTLFGKSITLALGWKPENGVVVPVISIQ